MQEKHLFEYAVIRIVPRVEREEFLNVGVVLFCPKKKFLQSVITMDRERLHSFAPHLDVSEVEEYLCAFGRICSGNADKSPIGKLDGASRFRWLTAPRSTVVQTSPIHPGLCSDPLVALERLHQQLVAVPTYDGR